MARVRKADLPRDGLGRLRAPHEPDEMAHLRGLGERVARPEEAVARGAALFDAERFFEAYVHFALAWKRTRAPGCRGLAQVAAGLCHVQRGNPEGARAVLERGRAALDGTVPAAVEAGELARRVDAFLDGLDGARTPPFPRLPRTGEAAGTPGARR